MSPGDAVRRPGGVDGADGGDPSALLSQALRAEAGRRGADTAIIRAADTGPMPTGGPSAAASIAVRWVLLIALSLGLAAGAVIGLLSLV